MDILFQGYSPQGLALTDKGVTKPEAAAGALHGAAHIWIWRRHGNAVEVLVQKRASTVLTWPDHYDVSAAGHIDFGEQPLEAALRETAEEIGLQLQPADLELFSVQRVNSQASADIIENEFSWLYLHELLQEVDFSLQADELAEVHWLLLSDFETACRSDTFVAHGELYCQTVIDAIKTAAAL